MLSSFCKIEIDKVENYLQIKSGFLKNSLGVFLGFFEPPTYIGTLSVHNVKKLPFSEPPTYPPLCPYE